GFCIPGMLVRAASLIERDLTSDRRVVAKALDGHFCRCTGYGRIIDSIQTAGEACKHGGRLPSREPRRHSYFGEAFGLSRNPEFARSQGRTGDAPAVSGLSRTNKNGIGTSTPRLGGLEQALGEKPFVGDMREPGMLHGAMG